MTEAQPILLIGGTRGTGLLIARLLLSRRRPVRVLARNPARATQALGTAPEIVQGDITDEASLVPALTGVGHIIFTAGRRSGRPVLEQQVRRTEYGGVVNTLTVATRLGFVGRFLYMTASGIGQRSFWTRALNIYKGNTLEWRQRAEVAIRGSGLRYTIIRTGVLLNAPGGRHAVVVTQNALPLSPRHRIARADVAEKFVEALDHPNTACTTFELVWDDDGNVSAAGSDFSKLRADPMSPHGSRTDATHLSAE